jgi:hypothetical protein
MRSTSILLLLIMLLGTSCKPIPLETEEDPITNPLPQPEPGPEPGPGPGPAPDPDPDPDPDPGPDPMPPVDRDFWAIMDQSCLWCHTTQNPEAGFDFSNHTIDASGYNEMANGVQLEMAPLMERLQRRDKDVLLGWLAARGATIPPEDIPSRYRWTLADEIASLPDGATAPGFAFIIEDGFIDQQAWTVSTYTDKHGRTYRGIALDQQRQVDQSIFTSSRNPSSYLIFRGVPYHGRFFNSRMEGDVRVGRWMSVGMATRTMEPTGRDKREYVRLQFDRDAISLRSAPTRLETWPWGDEADGRLTGNLNASGFYQTSSEWLHFVFESKRQADGVHWTAVVTNPQTGAVLADLHGVESLADPLQGTFFLHSYSTGDNDMWANLVFETQVDPND